MAIPVVLTIALIELLLTHGPTAYIRLIKGLETDDPTPDQIRALKVDTPESYFDNDDSV